MMKNNRIGVDRRWKGWLVTWVTCLPVLIHCGGGDAKCGPGTRANASGECVPVDNNGEVDCGPDAIPPAQQDAVATLKAVQLLNGETACEAATCKPGYELFAGSCGRVPDFECPTGSVLEGNTCVFPVDVSCYDNPDLPTCIPTICEDQPNSADGRALQPLGKCVPRTPNVAQEGCQEGCHFAIEEPHPWFQVSCTGCHGGDPAARTKETAHVAIPAQWQANQALWGRPNSRYYWNYLTLFGPGDGVSETDFMDWLHFRNPGDLRIADRSCGKESGCHLERVENVKRSVMATEVGLTAVALQRSGYQKVLNNAAGAYLWDSAEGMTLHQPSLDAVKYDGDVVGSVQRLVEFQPLNRDLDKNYDQVDVLREIYDKQCGDCHLGSAGQNHRYAEFRSSGCSSCHMNYALDGRSRSSDALIPKNEPSYPFAYANIANWDVNDPYNVNQAWVGPERPHPTTHRVTRTIAAQRCGTCHVGSNRTDWQFRGVQIDPNRSVAAAVAEGTLNADQFQYHGEDPNVNPFWLYHGQAYDQLLDMVDWNNDGYNDIPADLHYTAGLECMDCHTSGEMHNELKFVKVKKVYDWTDENQVNDMSGAIWSHQDQATEVECVHCHGNLEYRALPFTVDNRNPVRNMIACAENGETILYDNDNNANTPEVPYQPDECANLGRGRFLRSKFTGNWHYIPQTYDTVQDPINGVAKWPLNRGGDAVGNQLASIFHGRKDQDPSNGYGPCDPANPQVCLKDVNNANLQVTNGFSHLGQPAQHGADQASGGLECYACHATWQNGCFGCHLTLADNDGNNQLYDLSRWNGDLTLGQVAQADFSYISPLDVQYGINSEGKIAQMQPETKMAVRHVDYQNVDYFGDPNNGAQVATQNNTVYTSYRHISGYGLRQYATEQLGLIPNQAISYQDAQMDQNAGEGYSQMMPHSVQRANPRMDCQFCHLDANAANADFVSARWGANPNGFANVSDYLNVLNNVAIARNNTNDEFIPNAAAGFRFDANIDPVGFVVDKQMDWVVDVATGFSYAYTNHLLKQDARESLQFDTDYIRQYQTGAGPVQASGPLTLPLLQTMLNQVRVNNANVAYKENRR